MDAEEKIYFSMVAIGIAGLMAMTFITGCEQNSNEEVIYESCIVQTIKAKGEKHEYLFADRGLTHLPNCKYCLTNKVESVKR